MMRYTLAVMLFSVLLISSSHGTPTPDISSADRVEEDWQLRIDTADFAGNGPQITTCMSPGAADSSPFLIFNLNYRDYPAFSAGGLQVKVWSGGQVAASSSQALGQLQNDNESITWTQRMSLSGGNVNFKVLSGNSTTWGNFGVNDTDLAAGSATALDSLTGYSPDTSVAKSAVSFESNLVTSMTLLQVRYYQGGTLLYTDSTPRSVPLN